MRREIAAEAPNATDVATTANGAQIAADTGKVATEEAEEGTSYINKFEKVMAFGSLRREIAAEAPNAT